MSQLQLSCTFQPQLTSGYRLQRSQLHEEQTSSQKSQAARKNQELQLSQRAIPIRNKKLEFNDAIKNAKTKFNPAAVALTIGASAVIRILNVCVVISLFLIVRRVRPRFVAVPADGGDLSGLTVMLGASSRAIDRYALWNAYEP